MKLQTQNKMAQEALDYNKKMIDEIKNEFQKKFQLY